MTASIADNSVSVERLWNCSTRLTTAITMKGGKIVSRLMVNDAMAMSIRLRRSPMTTLVIQAKVNGASASPRPREARTRIASPVQALQRRNSSTAIGGSPSGANGSLRKTTFCSGLAPVSSAAVPP